MRNKGYRVLLISFVLLIILSLYINFKTSGSLWIVLVYVGITIIPALYSVIPLLKEQKIKRSSTKNRIADYTFTDRKEDIASLIDKLFSQEHILEIKGKEDQCGKSWLAKRLCDYINNPSDLRKLGINRKNPYNRSYYIDMEKCSEDDLNSFFQRKYIDSKVVLIFDHVKNLSELLSKQKIYHFQLVYILKNIKNCSFQSHTISEFDVSGIVELQSKIRDSYPDITSLTGNEVEVLYELTNGNIGKIHILLCEQRCINWVKDIAANRQTDYDRELNKIQTTLYVGKYTKAKDELNAFKEDYNDKMDDNNDLKYKYILMLSDCEHLLNNYENALNILSIIDNNVFAANNKDYVIELHKAHYLKHLWKCNDALEILWGIKNKCFSAAADSLGILLAKYFIDDLHVPWSDDNSLESFKNMFIFAQNSTLQHRDDDKLKIKRAEAIFLYYQNHPESPSELLQTINNVISIYKAQNNRLLANAYFIRGEIYRLYNDYENALSDYSHSLSVTIDNNITIQVQLMLYYLYKCKHIKNQSYSLLEIKDIMNLCSRNNYADKLFARIRSIEMNDSNAEEIFSCFDSRIMPIL